MTLCVSALEQENGPAPTNSLLRVSDKRRTAIATPWEETSCMDHLNEAEPIVPSIWARGLTKTYKGDKKTGDIVAVDHIDLQVTPGEFYGFLGPNGAGKSTTIKMLTGLLRPTSGQIVIAGHDLAAEPLEVKRAIGVLPEDLNLYERLTAGEFLLFAAQMYGLSAEEGRRRAAALLDVMELGEAGGKLIVDFSMGMKKKTALAGAMIHEPRVLFLDEPFNGIDALSSRKIRDVLKQRTVQGTTIFFSSHVLEVVEKLCTRVAIIAGGRLVGEGTIDELRAQTHDSSLEDIFIHLVEGGSDEGEAQAFALTGGPERNS
jgi:ABC-2 type transport system ATP-binding protein